MDSKHNSKLHGIPQYVGWLMRRYIFLRELDEQNNVYRLVGVTPTLSGRHKLKIQLFDSKLIFDSTPLEVVRNDEMVIGFSRQNVRLITYLACEELYKPKLVIRLKRFCRKLKRTVFFLHDGYGDDLLEKTATEISADKNLLAKMSALDSHEIGFIAGNESVKAKALADFAAKFNFDPLGKREAESFVALLEGKTAKQTAYDLGVSTKSVEFYIAKVKSKFHCYTKGQLLDKAFAAGLIDVVSPEVFFTPPSNPTPLSDL